MKQVVVVFGLVVALGVVLGLAPAGAGPSNGVSVTLSCDRGVGAVVTVTVEAEYPGSVGPMRCGPETSKNVRVPFAMTSEPTGVVVTTFLVDGSVDCSGIAPSPIPTRIECPSSGRGARLVVR